MAIYDMFDRGKGNQNKEGGDHALSRETALMSQTPSSKRDRFFSSLAARLFFLLLLGADFLWFVYAVVLVSVAFLGAAITLFKMSVWKMALLRGWIALRRSLVCGLSLFIALLNPSFGIMIACTYFLMYDKAGIEEVVPASFRSQFTEFFPPQEM